MIFDGQKKLAEWHDIVFNRNLSGLSAILADDVTFSSPVFWKPKQGKMAAFIILSTVIEVFEDFEYHRQWLDGTRWALEFSARVGDLSVKGIDLFQFHEAGQIIDLEVMMRPLNGVQALGAEMRRRLAEKGLDITAT
jgi:hypothetical protein